jgi:hypothetical protein
MIELTLFMLGAQFLSCLLTANHMGMLINFFSESMVMHFLGSHISFPSILMRIDLIDTNEMYW